MELFDERLVQQIGTKFIANKENMAVAESVTSGLLQFAFSNSADASQFFQGGLTVYNLAQKFKHLQVEPQAALQCNCVSQEVAGTMALQVAKLYVSHWAIGITGYATPVPESGNPVFAYYAIVHHNKVILRGRLAPTSRNPCDIQRAYVDSILRKLNGKIGK